MLPSVATPWKRRRHGAKPWRFAIASTAMKPMLWRLAACLAPGLPRPTNSSMDQHQKIPATDVAGTDVAEVAASNAPYFFSGAAAPAAGAAAPAAGAAAPAAGAAAPPSGAAAA